MTSHAESGDFGAFYAATYQRAYRTALVITARPRRPYSLGAIMVVAAGLLALLVRASNE